MMTIRENNRGKNDLIDLVTKNNRPKFCDHDNAKHRVRAGLSPIKILDTDESMSPLPAF